eukprot:298414-Chlamydomonas_euryale.AAC.2
MAPGAPNPTSNSFAFAATTCSSRSPATCSAPRLTLARPRTSPSLIGWTLARSCGPFCSAC